MVFQDNMSPTTALFRQPRLVPEPRTTLGRPGIVESSLHASPAASNAWRSLSDSRPKRRVWAIGRCTQLCVQWVERVFYLFPVSWTLHCSPYCWPPLRYAKHAKQYSTWHMTRRRFFNTAIVSRARWVEFKFIGLLHSKYLKVYETKAKAKAKKKLQIGSPI